MNKLKHIYYSLKWINRKQNKDDLLIIETRNIGLFILFDGVSSSENAIQWIKIIKKFVIENLHKYILDNNIDLKGIILGANNFLISQKIDESYTTCSAFVYSYTDNSGKILSIWDSRIYWVFKQYKEQLTIDDNDTVNKSLLTDYLWKQLNYDTIHENLLDSEYLKNWNILICSDGFYEKLENNLVLFHKVLNYNRPWMIKNKLFREIKDSNCDDSTYIYILTNKYV